MNEFKKMIIVKLFAWMILFVQISEGNKKEVFQMEINERGTKFNETIEIDDKLKTIVYKVPSHNDIKESDYLVDYKNGQFVTRFPERKACFLKPFPTADEPSLRETKQNLKILQYYKAVTKAAVPIKTIKKMIKLIREIPRDELTSKIVSFCGNYTAYQVKEEDVPNELGGNSVENDIGKRSGIRNTNYYTYNLLSAHQQSFVSNLPSGYVWSCKTVDKYTQDVVSCLTRGRSIKLRCGLEDWKSCRFQATCWPVSFGSDTHSITALSSHVPRIQIKVKCKEMHVFTAQFCCHVHC